MDPNELTAAHRSLPFGTRVLVENLSNGRSVVVRINDRGPFIGGRIIDLSKAAAASIGMINAGTAKVRVTTTDGGALEALGEATAKAKDGTSVAAAGKVDIAPSELSKEITASTAPSTSKDKRLEATASVSVKSSASKARVAAATRPTARTAKSSVQFGTASKGDPRRSPAGFRLVEPPRRRGVDGQSLRRPRHNAGLHEALGTQVRRAG